MSHYCTSHPRYEAKREPKSLCGNCWRLYFYRCPEEKAVDPVTPADLAWAQKNLASHSGERPKKG